MRLRVTKATIAYKMLAMGFLDENAMHNTHYDRQRQRRKLCPNREALPAPSESNTAVQIVGMVRRLIPRRTIPGATGFLHRFESFLWAHQHRGLTRLDRATPGYRDGER